MSLDAKSLKSNPLITRAYWAAVNAGDQRAPLHVLITGRTGRGKSSTVNELIGHGAAKVSDHKVGTTIVSPYRRWYYGVPVVIFDSPGFGDAEPIVGNDQKYIEQMRAAVPKPDVMVFMTSLAQKNVEDFDVEVLKIIFGAFGKDRVKASLILALSYADRFRDDLPRRVTVWLRELYEIISMVSGLDTLSVATIPAVAVSNGNLDGRNSIEELWLLLLSRGGVGSRILLRAVGSEF